MSQYLSSAAVVIGALRVDNKFGEIKKIITPLFWNQIRFGILYEDDCHEISSPTPQPQIK